MQNKKGSCLSAFIFAFACFSASTLAALPATHTLSNGLLTVEVMDPNAPGRYNTGVRFSPVANVLQVTADGRTFLFSPEKHDSVTDNGGLAMEFDLGGKDGPQPVSFVAAAHGDPFVKVGVGVLRKTTSKYEFYTQYPIVERAPTRAEWTLDSAVFTQTCAGANGFAYELGATITLSERTLRIRYTLANTGRRVLSTEHYTHNFFLLNGRPIGCGYAVHFGAALPDGGVYDGARREKTSLHFDQAPAKPLNLAVLVAPGRGCEWSSFAVADGCSGQRIDISTTRPPARFAIHVSSRYLCPEQFVLIELAPGKTATWERSFTFSTNDTTTTRTPCKNKP